MENPFEEIIQRLERMEALLREIKGSPIVDPNPQVEQKTLHSIRELADFLGCTTVTAQKFKNEKRIPYYQVGRKVMFDTVKVLEALKKHEKGRGWK
jgi:excisionase family DNA binding protein